MVQQHAADVRQARPEDAEAIRRIARSSFEYTYTDVLTPETIGTVVERWYDRDALEDRLDDQETVLLVAESGTEIQGFAEAVLEADGDVGAIDWLHVDPHHRGRGVGESLLSAMEAALVEEGADRIEGRVLRENEVGNGFYRAEGYTLTGSTSVEIEDQTVAENRYLSFPGVDTVEGLLEPVEKGGGTVYVALDERERGAVAPFYQVYLDEDRTEPYGYCCANCRSMAVTMDPMGQMTCEDCENRRKPTRWDAAYL